MIVAPLIFGGIVTGIAGHNQLKGVGRVALKSIIFFEAVTTIGLLLGLIAIDLTRAGVGVLLPAAAAAPAAHPETWQQILLNIFPENIALAVAQNQILQVAVFSLLFGAALAMLPEAKREPMVKVLQSLTDAMFKMTKIIMLIAPLAAGAAMAYTIGSTGLSMIMPLAKLVGTYYGSAAIFVLFVLAPILAFARISPTRFARAIAEPTAIAFATTSSEAALPLAMERMEEFGVPRWIVSFVVPLGYSFNMTGSSLYLTMAAIFAAQAAGIHLSIGEQLVMLVHPHAHQQRSSRRASRHAGSANGLSRAVAHPHRRHPRFVRRRYADGHGPQRHERSRQRHGRRRRRAMGRRHARENGTVIDCPS